MSNPNDFVIENGVLKKYVGPGGDVVVPEGVETMTCRIFYALEGNRTVTQIVIPESVKRIESGAFLDCRALQAVAVHPDNTEFCDMDGVLFNKDKTELICFPADRGGAYSVPNGVIIIRWGAFYGCKELTQVSFPESLKKIEGAAFSGCNKISNLCLPESLKTIEQSAFLGNSCKSIAIPSHVSKMGESGRDVFYGDELESIDVASDNRSFCSVDGVLYNKKKTKLLFCPTKKAGAVKVEDGTTSIVAGAFQDCKELTQITLPKTLEKIGRVAFIGCTTLKAVSVPGTVSQIGENAFRHCSALSELTMNEGIVKIGVGAFMETALIKVVLPKTITNLGPDTFPKETILMCTPAILKKLSKETKYRIAEYYLTNQSEFGAEEASGVEAFISAEKRVLLQKLIESENAAAITAFHSKFPITGKQLESLVKESAERYKPTVTAVLLEIGKKK